MASRSEALLKEILDQTKATNKSTEKLVHIADAGKGQGNISASDAFKGAATGAAAAEGVGYLARARQNKDLVTTLAKQNKRTTKSRPDWNGNLNIPHVKGSGNVAITDPSDPQGVKGIAQKLNSGHAAPALVGSDDNPFANLSKGAKRGAKDKEKSRWETADEWVNWGAGKVGRLALISGAAASLTLGAFNRGTGAVGDPYEQYKSSLAEGMQGYASATNLGLHAFDGIREWWNGLMRGGF